MDFASLSPAYGYLAIVAGSFLDGETVIVLAGAASAHGHLALPLVILLGALVNWAWDQFYFRLGRSHGPAIVRRYPRIAPGLARAARLLDRHQALFIVGMRFMVGLRIAGPVALGLIGVRPAMFAACNAIGALLWSALTAGIGFVGLHVLRHRFDDVDPVLVTAVVMAAVLMLAGVLVVRHMQRRAVVSVVPS